MGKLAGYNSEVVSVLTGITADDTIALFKAPFGGATVKNAYVISPTTLAASTADYFSIVLKNGGTTGTATAAIGTVGGTTGWVADTQQAFTLNTAADELAVGEWLVATYDETGTVAVGEIAIVVEWVHGKG